MTTNQSASKPFKANEGDFGLTKIDQLIINKQEGFYGVTKPVTVRIPDTDAATAANYTTPFFIADRTYEILSAVERHEVAGSSGSAVTLTVEKVPSGTAPGSGTVVLASTFDLKGTANTNQEAVVLQTYSGSVPVRRLSRGDALTLKTSGTLTAVDGVCVSVLLRSI
jgi:hypothetical protein